MSDNRKTRRQERDDKRAIERTNNILSGRVKIGQYEERPKKPAQANRKGGSTPSREQEEEMIREYTRICDAVLPGILARLSGIKDPRNPNMIDHSLSTLMMYGIVMFASHMSSRREANRKMGSENAFANMKAFLPGLESMPHADTLERLLEKISVEEIEQHYSALLQEFIRSAEFRKLNPGRYLIAIDGTQKYTMNTQSDERALCRHIGPERQESYYVYMLESILIMENGMILPLLSEPLENDGTIDGDKKQDCELKAFSRLIERLEKLLGKGTTTVVVDGLYACGPVISKLNNYGWQYMITLKCDSLKTVWEEFDGLRRIEKGNTASVQWGNREQRYDWVNSIEYIYGKNHKKLTLNVVTCAERWKEEHSKSSKKPEEKVAHYAWLSSQPLKETNLFNLCTDIARKRWRIENHFLTEKHQGYNYSHCYSHNWNAMKGWHYLMKIGHFLNAIILEVMELQPYVKAEGKCGFIEKVWRIIHYRTGSPISNSVSQDKSPDRNKSSPKIHYAALNLKTAKAA